MFPMQTLDALLTRALTYNWAHYLNIQHEREEKDINFELSSQTLERLQVIESMREMLNLKSNFREKISIRICGSSAAWRRRLIEPKNGKQTNKTIKISTDKYLTFQP